MIIKFVIGLTSLLTLFSCGKEIKNSGKQTRVSTQSALSGNGIELKYKMNENNHFFEIPKGGWAIIPEGPVVVSGEPDSFRSSLYFNTSTLSLLNDEVESIRCDYSSVKIQEEDEVKYDHHFKGCYASVYSYEEEVNYKPGQEILLDPGKQIIFSVVLFNEKEEIQISSEIEIDWH